MVVDWVRACYQSEWQLIKDRPDLRTSGRYYFSPPGTPHYRGTHNLGSRHWNDANWPHTVELGEALDVRQVFDRGLPPFVAVRTRSVGTADCIANGEEFDKVVNGVDCIDGFIPACVIPQGELDRLWSVVSSYSECPTQRIYCFLILALYMQDHEEINRIILDWLGDVPTVVIHNHTGILPGIITITTAEWSVAICDGTTNFQEIALQGFEFIVGPTNQGAFSTAQIWFTASSYVQTILSADGMAIGAKIMVVGHSYGGAAALIAGQGIACSMRCVMSSF